MGSGRRRAEAAAGESDSWAVLGYQRETSAASAPAAMETTKISRHCLLGASAESGGSPLDMLSI